MLGARPPRLRGGARRSAPRRPHEPRTARAQLPWDWCIAIASLSIERELKDLSPEERRAERPARSVPALNELHAWLTAQSAIMLPKSSFGKAVTYCLNPWDKLQGYLLDDRLEIDNNRTERAIKPFAIGRKNRLFSNTPRGARISAILYSLVETAKENGLKPFEYITYLLECMPNLNLAAPGVLESLMPWSESLPAACRMVPRSA